jgi:hypothetical protein
MTDDPQDLKHRLTELDAARAAVDRHLVLLRQHVYALPGAPAAEGTSLASVVDEYRRLKATEDEAAAALDALL